MIKDTLQILAVLLGVRWLVIEPMKLSVALTQPAAVAAVVCCSLVLVTVAVGLSIKHRGR